MEPETTVSGHVEQTGRPWTVEKARVGAMEETNPEFRRLIFAYLASATTWLVLGTLVGLFLGLALIWPALGQAQWLSFGRLRPVHTNTVFWGWSSLGMLGLAHYVVAKTSRVPLYSHKLGWVALALINSAVIAGSALLIAGVNNGAQEYREYIWPVMALFGGGLAAVAINFYRTIRARKTREIYLSNWWILAALLWTLTLATIAYAPGYQEGLGQTIIQGYYMHQGVGMWFTPMVLGLTYYFLPRLLDTPIYSYSLGALAFATQLLFYTMIGSHHFVFSPIPWWLQTVAIVFSVGMIVPVAAGTANFVLTARGHWGAIRKSYALPFIAVGVFYYFVGSMQGSLEALRTANLYWHFTNFTVGHSHLTMYGFVGFLIWGGIYGLAPRLTGREPPQFLVGAHFWLAFVGLAIYGISMSVGGTVQGASWLAGEPFMESVRAMVPYWVWRAVGGTLMFVSHIAFAYNLLVMMQPSEQSEAGEVTHE